MLQKLFISDKRCSFELSIFFFIVLLCYDEPSAHYL